MLILGPEVGLATLMMATRFETEDSGKIAAFVNLIDEDGRLSASVELATPGRVSLTLSYEFGAEDGSLSPGRD
jgi:hypothetical protein